MFSIRVFSLTVIGTEAALGREKSTSLAQGNSCCTKAQTNRINKKGDSLIPPQKKPLGDPLHNHAYQTPERKSVTSTVPTKRDSTIADTGHKNADIAQYPIAMDQSADRQPPRDLSQSLHNHVYQTPERKSFTTTAHTEQKNDDIAQHQFGMDRSGYRQPPHDLSQSGQSCGNQTSQNVGPSKTTKNMNRKRLAAFDARQQMILEMKNKKRNLRFLQKQNGLRRADTMKQTILNMNNERHNPQVDPSCIHVELLDTETVKESIVKSFDKAYLSPSRIVYEESPELEDRDGIATEQHLPFAARMEQRNKGRDVKRQAEVAFLRAKTRIPKTTVSQRDLLVQQKQKKQQEEFHKDHKEEFHKIIIGDCSEGIPIVDFHVQNSITQKYQFHEKLGNGAFGTVFKVQDIETQKEFAVKRIKVTKDMKLESLWSLENEICILKHLSTLNRKWHVASVKEVYYTEDTSEDIYGHIDIVLPLASGDLGSLMFRKTEDGGTRFNQITDMRAVASIIKAILLGVKTLHDEDIVHRDLKPQNFLLQDIVTSNNKKGQVIQVADFGLATFVPQNTIPSKVSVGGTRGYIPPEAYVGQVGPATDIWAIGVMAYQMIFGRHPFDYDLRKPIDVNKVKQAKAMLENKLLTPEKSKSSEWTDMDEHAKNFIEACFQRFDDRPTATELLRHPFVVGENVANPSLDKPSGTSMMSGSPSETHSQNSEEARRAMGSFFYGDKQISGLGSITN